MLERSNVYATLFVPAEAEVSATVETQAERKRVRMLRIGTLKPQVSCGSSERTGKSWTN